MPSEVFVAAGATLADQAKKPPQEPNLGPSDDFGGTGVTRCVVAHAAVLVALWGGSGAGSGAEPPEATPPALLVSGTRHFQEGAMKTGLLELERAVELSPTWEPARRALAMALLRSGRFERAEKELVLLLGSRWTSGLESGDLKIGPLDRGTDTHTLFALAVTRRELGGHREAERLYRAYADLVGPTSTEAAAAYYHLFEMMSAYDMPWGDPEAERAKALALDPGIESRTVLPRLPEPGDVPEAEPYLRPIDLAGNREQPVTHYETLPVLIRWSPPEYAGSSAAPGGRAQVEILVGADGYPAEVHLPDHLELEAGCAVAVTNAVMSWAFEPAVAGEDLEPGGAAADSEPAVTAGDSDSAVARGDPASVWILFEVEIPVESAAPDTLTAAPEDTLLPAAADTPAAGAANTSGEATIP